MSSEIVYLHQLFHNTVAEKTVHRFNHASCFFVLAVTTWGGQPAQCQAQLFYDFILEGTGDVLATLELSTLPATASDVAGLTFSPAGQTIFGYPATYLGTFDSGGIFLSDGLMGLDHSPPGVSLLYDANPPASSQYPGIIIGAFEVVANSARDGDALTLKPALASGIKTVRFGDWRLVVPEPTSAGLVVVAGLCGAVRRRRYQA